MEPIPLTPKHTNDISLPDIEEAIAAIGDEYQEQEQQDIGRGDSGRALSFIPTNSNNNAKQSPSLTSMSRLNFVDKLSGASMTNEDFDRSFVHTPTKSVGSTFRILINNKPVLSLNTDTNNSGSGIVNNRGYSPAGQALYYQNKFGNGIEEMASIAEEDVYGTPLNNQIDDGTQFMDLKQITRDGKLKGKRNRPKVQRVAIDEETEKPFNPPMSISQHS